MTLRRMPEAMEQIEQAVELDPLAPIPHHVLGWVTSASGKGLEALPHYETSLKLNPNLAVTTGNIANLYLELGDYDQARLWIRKWGELAGVDTSIDLAVIDAIENPALHESAIKRLQTSPDHFDSAISKAYYFLLLGEVDLALQSLEKGFVNGDPWAVQANSAPIFEVLRDNPRFQAHLKKMSLWPETDDK